MKGAFVIFKFSKMEIKLIFGVKMAVAMLSLFLLLQLPLTLGSDLVVWSKYCGADQISSISSSGNELFYINGNLVDKDLFSKAVKYYYENHYIFEGRLESDNNCKLDLQSVDSTAVDAKVGRKLLQGGIKEEYIERDGKKTLLTPKMTTVAVPAGLVLCCGLLCSCFRAKRKQTDANVLAKEPSSIRSVHSHEVNPGFDKIPASPLRVPGSPLRVPGNPLRVPASPRISLSPPVNRIGSVHLSMSQVTRATQNFSSSLQIGEGGFGTVYKARLHDGQIVAMKRAKKEHLRNLQNEFSREVELLARIEHRNLVRLLGYVDRGNERIIITEYVPNGTLREHLDGKYGKILDFNQRLEISIDVAHALTYLHLYTEKQIIHRDVKSSNILLTESMRAKVADFGFAKLGPVDTEETHVSTQVRGTVGYLDPEYMRTYQLTPKSDVYSFGILLLEILTARRPVEVKRPIEERVTIRWAFRNYNEGNIVGLVDPLMDEVVDVEVLTKMFGLAFECAAPTRADRPDMKQVGEQLWAIRMDYVQSIRRV